MDAIEAEKAKFSLLLIHPLIGIFISGGGGLKALTEF